MSDFTEQDKPTHVGGRWPKGVSGNPGGRPKVKPFREALQRLLDERNGAHDAATALYARAMTGDVAAFRECADRIEGKVPQAIIGGDENEPAIKLETIRRVIVKPSGHPDSGDIPAAAEPKPV